jgi:hypothetical protein
LLIFMQIEGEVRDDASARLNGSGRSAACSK